MNPNSLLTGGIIYVGIPVAVGLVEGAEAGKTTAAVVVGGGLGGYIGASIGAMASNGAGADLNTAVVGIEIGGLIGAILGGLAGYKAWQSYKHTSLPSGHSVMSNPRKRRMIK